MRRLGSVQQKMPCIFLTEVKEEHSRKRECQQFQVVATTNVNPVALQSNIDRAIATEKLDGTCCYVTMHKGQPYLWARLDRKPNKQAEKRFRKYQHSQRGSEVFTWNFEEDFKTVPETWIPAQKVVHHNGHPVPDEHGHVPGWVPVAPNNKMYCWHSSVVDYDEGVALVLRPTTDDEDQLEITTVPLSNLLEKTLELIGTNINGNPYGMGSKKHPVHTLVAHGSVPIRNPPPVDHHQLCSWFLDSKEGQVEGIVWHCNDGTLVKLHRHHLGLKWPDGDTFLNTRPIVIHVDGTVDEERIISKDLFTAFSRLNGHCLTKLQDLQLVM
ncbi:RNA ligase 1 [Aplochiton taeniatus]